VSQKAWTTAQRRFRKDWGFPRSWRTMPWWVRFNGAFNDGFLQGWDAANVAAKKRKCK